MPEGFNSIDDLKVVISAQTEQLSGGLEAARGMIAKFAGDGDSSLKKFDGSLAALGTRVEWLRGKFGIWLTAIETVLKLIENYGQYGQSVASAFGAEAEYESLGTSLGELKETYTGLFTRVKEQGPEATKAFIVGLMDTSTKAKETADALEMLTKKIDDDVFTMSQKMGEFGVPLPEQDELDRARFGIQAYSKDAIAAGQAVVVVTRQMGEAMKEAMDRNADLERTSAAMQQMVDAARDEIKIEFPTPKEDELQKVTASVEGYDKLVKSIAQIPEAAKKARGDLVDLTEAIDKARNRDQERSEKGFMQRILDDAKQFVNDLTDFGQKVQGVDQMSEQALERELVKLNLSLERLRGGAKEASKELQTVNDMLRVPVSGDTNKLIAEIEDRIRLLDVKLDYFRQAKQFDIPIWNAAEVKDSAESVVKSMEKAVRSLEQKAVAANLSGEALHRYNALMGALNTLEDQGASAMGRSRQRIDELAAATGRLKQAEEERKKDEGQDKALDQILGQLDKDIIRLESEARQYFMTAEAAATLKAEEALLLAARQRGRPINEDLIAFIKNEAQEYGRAAAGAKQLGSEMKTLQESGQIVSRTLSSAFDSWMRGTEVKGKEMVATLLREFAKLILIKNALEPLFGGSGQGAGLFGNLFGGLFGGGGARAGGGRVDMGVPYLVGEKRPEVFVPDRGGRIMADAAGGGARAVSVPISISVDASGAYPESMEDIKRALGSLEATLPGRIVQVVGDARERALI